jgi:signal transduction histidine kinase
VDEREINDLDTARLALHGLLAQNRSIQELNERLKGEIQDALHREKLAAQKTQDVQVSEQKTRLEIEQIQNRYKVMEAETREKIRQELLAVDRRGQREKDKELTQLREDALHKEKAIKDLQQQAEAAQARASAQLNGAIERARAQLQDAVEAAVQDKEALLKGVQLYSAQQIAELHARCQDLEGQLAAKDQSLTLEFHERNKALTAQWKARERDLWEQGKKNQETLEKELKERLDLRLSSLSEERRQEKAAYQQKMWELDEKLSERKELLRNEFETREKEIRAVYESSEADMEKRLAERIPSIEQQRMQEKAALERQMGDFEHQWLKREAAVRGEYESLETQVRRGYEARENQIRADQRASLQAVEADWAARVNALQDEFALTLSEERKKTALQAAALRGDMERQRTTLNEEAAKREHALRDQHAAAERSMMEEARQTREDLLRKFQIEFEQQNKKHAEVLLVYGNTVSGKHREELANYETHVTTLDCERERQDARLKVLEAELERAAAERARFISTLAAREQEWAAMDDAAQLALHTREKEFELEKAQREQAHARQISALEYAMAEKEKTLAAGLQTDLERQHAAFAQRMLELGKGADYNLEKLREEYLSHERALTARSADVHKHEMELIAEKERQQQEFRTLREELARQSAALDLAFVGVRQQQDRLKNEENALQAMVAKAQAMEEECRQARDKLLQDFREGVDVATDSTQTMQSIMEEGIFGFAHQIRNPLAIIRSITETFADPKAAAGADKKSLDWILQSVDGLSRRLEEFIAFSKPVPLSFTRVDFAEVLRKELVTIQPRAARQSVQIRADAESLPEISGNPEHFQVILHEIFMNSLEAMPKGGSLKITAQADPTLETVTVEIHDSGSGINPVRLRDVGRPFFTTKADRTGLGLARARRLLHLYAGQFKIESAPGQGTTVICTFRRKGWAR